VITIIVAMFVILALAGATAGVVVVGIEGRGKWRAPKLAERVTRAAQHLNGDAQRSR